MGQLRISVRPATDAEFTGAAELLERLDLPDEKPFLDEGGWSAHVELDASPLLLRAREGRWTIYGDDDAMPAARRLHGLLGGSAGGWDLDR